MQKKKFFFSNTVKAIPIALWFPVTVPHGLVLPRLGPPKVSSAFDFRFALCSNIALLVISVRPRKGICCMRHCRQNQTERKWQLCDSPSPSANSISIFICGALNHIQEASRINQSEEEAADPSRVSMKRRRPGKAAWKTVTNANAN